MLQAHATTVRIPEDLRVMFSYTDKPENRNYIYIYILDKLADTSKRLHVCKKIVNDIFGKYEMFAIFAVAFQVEESVLICPFLNCSFHSR